MVFGEHLAAHSTMSKSCSLWRWTEICSRTRHHKQINPSVLYETQRIPVYPEWSDTRLICNLECLTFNPHKNGRGTSTVQARVHSML